MNVGEDNMEPNELPDYLQSLRHLHTYKVPANYFDELADEILNKVNMPLSAGLPLSAPPVNYFTDLADTILLKIKNGTAQSEVQKELEEIEPSFALIPKTNVYRVPDGYFDSFKVSVPATPKASPVIKLHRPAKWFTYIAAAIITGIIATGVVFFANENVDGGGTANYTQALANVTDNEISDYLDNTSTDADLTPASQDGNDINNSETLYQLLLNNVSDNDIQDYLNANDDSDEQNSQGI